MNELNQEIVVALDIGTTKICALAGYLNEYDQVEIVGVGKVESTGVSRGVVTNIEKTINAISDAIRIAETHRRLKITKVYVGIAGQHIKSIQHRGMIMREDISSEIEQKDIAKLISDTHRLMLPAGDKILHVIPQEYTVDGEQGIVDPIGMSGAKLEGNLHVITGQISASHNIFRCVERAGLKALDMTLEPIASAEAVLTTDEKEAGVVLVDIGGGTTDLTIFYGGIIRHTAVVPFGGNVITSDIKEGCSVMQQQAEKLKIQYGSALADAIKQERILVVEGLRGRDHKEISERNLARIIQARMEEIMDLVLWEIRRCGYERKLHGGIVLTGGGALLRDIQQMCEYHTGMHTRIGTPIEHLAQGYSRDIDSPIYATGIGLLIKGIAKEKHLIQVQKAQAASLIDERNSTPIPATPSSMQSAPQPQTSPLPQEKVVPPTTAIPKDSNLTERGTSPKSRTFWGAIFERTKSWFEADPDRDHDDIQKA